MQIQRGLWLLAIRHKRLPPACDKISLVRHGSGYCSEYNRFAASANDRLLIALSPRNNLPTLSDNLQGLWVAPFREDGDDADLFFSDPKLKMLQ